MGMAWYGFLVIIKRQIIDCCVVLLNNNTTMSVYVLFEDVLGEIRLVGTYSTLQNVITKINAPHEYMGRPKSKLTVPVSQSNYIISNLQNGNGTFTFIGWEKTVKYSHMERHYLILESTMDQ